MLVSGNVMEVIVSFDFFGEWHEFRRNISDFDRNDAKEPYAYFNEFLYDENKTRFEITLLKNKNGELTKDYAYAMVYMTDAYGKEEPRWKIPDVEVEFRDAIDDKLKYFIPPKPDGIKAEIEYLKDKMLDITGVKEIPASMLPNPNHADENETVKSTLEWDDNFYWIISSIGAWLLIGFIILLLFK